MISGSAGLSHIGKLITSIPALRIGSIPGLLTVIPAKERHPVLDTGREPRYSIAHAMLSEPMPQS